MALYAAVVANDIEAVRVELAKPGVADIINAVQPDRHTLLTKASEAGYVDIVRLLLASSGINVNATGRYGDTSLIIAIIGDNLEIVRLLLAAPGINVNAPYSQPPLHFAINCFHLEIVRELLAVPGINVNAETIGGITALYRASQRGLLEIVRLLLAVPGINVNTAAKDGKTALFIACERDNIEIVRLLLAVPGIDVERVKTKACRKEFTNPEINNLLCHFHAAPGQFQAWKGFSKSTIEMFDFLLNNEASAGRRSPAENWSACPVCLKYVERSSGCMYMNHDCSAENAAEFHRGLYDMYKNVEGKIYWCTICNRICLGHRHYKLTNYDVKAELAPFSSNPNFFGDDGACKAQGGGGIDEKIARIRRMREYALELEDDIGTMDTSEAMKQLIEETWNAPTQRYGKKVAKIRANRAWNIPANRFHPNAPVAPPVEEPVGPAWNIAYPNTGNPDLLPVIHARGTNHGASGEEEDNVIQFRHRLASGEINNHEENYVAIDPLFLEFLPRRVYDEERGRCWAYPDCKARMFPAELQYILDNVTGVSEEKMTAYRTELGKYTKAFGRAVLAGGRRKNGRKTRRKQKGGADERFTIGPATLAECALAGGARKTRRKRGTKMRH